MAGQSKWKKPDDQEILDSCFKLVLYSCENKIIDMKDDEGETALYFAVKGDFQDGVLLLLKRRTDIMLPIHGTPIVSSVSTPMLEAILDDCLECNDEPETSEDLKLSFSYEILNKIMPHMAECPHQRALQKNPVTSCFINLHYDYVALFYVINKCIYAFPLLVLTYELLFTHNFLHKNWIKLCSMWSFSIIYDFVIGARMDVFKYLGTVEYYLPLPMLIFFSE